MLKSIDLLGPEIKLSIESKSNYKSYLGAFTTIFLLLLSTGAFIGFGLDIFLKLKPKVMFNSIVNDKIPTKNITDSNFLFAIYDQASDKPIADFDRRFFPSFDFYNTSADGSYTVKKRISFVKCRKDVITKWEGYYARIGKDNYLCFPPNQIWQLSGIILQGNYTSMRIQLEYCQNNTDPSAGPVRSDCINKQDTINFLAGKRIQMHYIIENTLINTLNFSNPGLSIAFTGYTNTDPLSWSRLNILFKNIITNTDIGFFLETFYTNIYEAIYSISNEAIYSPQTTAVFSHLLGNSRYKEIYERYYIKIQDIFAIMGGFINAALIILRLFIYYMNKPRMLDLFNNILKFKSDEQISGSNEVFVHDQKINISQDISNLKISENDNNILQIEKTEVINHNIQNKKMNFVPQPDGNTKSNVNIKRINDNEPFSVYKVK